nr:SLA class II histocompatibility antigen, DQ haplotype C beta chain-like [Loxodonta africana]
MKGPAAEKETEVPLMVGSPGVWTSGLLLAQPGLAPCSPGSFKCTRGGATAMSFNSTQRFLERYIYNEEEYIQLDSNVGVFKAMTELDQTTAKNWNIQKEFLELRRQAVDVVCKHKDELDKGFTLKSRGDGLGGRGKTLEVWIQAAEEGKGLCPFSEPQHVQGLCFEPKTGGQTAQERARLPVNETQKG